MADSNDSNKQLPLSALLIMLAALSVIFIEKSPFQGTRPDIAGIPEQQQTVKARLWQDPFQAVLDAKVDQRSKADTDPKAGSQSMDDSAKIISWQSAYSPLKEEMQKKPRPEKITVLGIMVFGALNAEEREVRIRHRYAAVSALSRLGFSPESAQDLGYITLPDLKKRSRKNTDVMPYEWFANKEDTVLLLWLNDDYFENDPIEGLKQLSRGLSEDPAGMFPLKIIGPAGGGTLLEMLKVHKDDDVPPGGASQGETQPSQTSGGEAAKPKADGTGVKEGQGKQPDLITKAVADVSGGQKDNKPVIEIYSPTATVDDRLLLETLPERNFTRDPSQCVEERFKQEGMLFKRTICTDRELAEQIFSELQIRGIDLRDSDNHIVLISEWDTYYGRSLANIYRSVFFDKAVLNPSNRIHSFSYIRGVDGKVPTQSESKGASSQEASSAKAKKEADAELERASGTSQFDYIRRLAEEIHDYEQAFTGGGKVKAIGILGSDFHDKYLVLQAMRQRFPQAVFFTTDLDARMLHPEALPWTRNLVVASSFDLNLRSDDKLNVQGGSPPFRDSFQTSIFATVLRSLGAQYLDSDLQRVLEKKPQPKIFEIGRYRAVDLSEDPLQKTSFDPRPQEAANSKEILKKVIAILILLALLVSLSTVQARDLLSTAFRDKRRRIVTGLVILLVVVSTLLFWKLILLAPHKEEPFSFVQGVSVWPTELLRITAAALSIFFIWKGSVDIHQNNCDIARTFRLRRPVPRESPPDAVKEAMKETEAKGAKIRGVRKKRNGLKSDFLTLFRTFSDVTRYDWDVPRVAVGKTSRWCTPRPEKIEEFWGEYLRRDSFYFRIRRLAPIVISYFLLCGLIISFGKPEPPVRGALSMLVDGIVLKISVLGSILVIFYAFDVIRTCRRLTQLIAEHPPTWSEQSYHKVAGSWADTAKKAESSKMGGTRKPAAAAKDAYAVKKDLLQGAGIVREGGTVNQAVANEAAAIEAAAREAAARRAGAREADVKTAAARETALKAPMREWMLIEFIAARTEVIGKMVFYPLIVWFLLFVSRLNYFDNWRTPIGLLIVISLAAAFAWSCAFVLRGSAEEARQTALERLVRAEAAAIAGNFDEMHLKRIHFASDSIKSIKRGAFAPFTQNPVVQALMVPFGGVGGILILDFLSKMRS